MSMQKVTLPSARLLKWSFFLLTIGFHLTLLLTNAGNYFHGGSPIELIALQATSVLIIAIGLKLVSMVGNAAKLIIIAGAVIPVVFVLGALWQLI